MISGAVETLAFDLHVAPERPAGVYTNTASVTADNPEAITSTNTSAITYTVQTSATLSIVKNALASEMVAGGGEVDASSRERYRSGPDTHIDPEKADSVRYPDIAPASREPAEFAAVAAPRWSERDSRSYHLSKAQTAASEKPPESG